MGLPSTPPGVLLAVALVAAACGAGEPGPAVGDTRSKLNRVTIQAGDLGPGYDATSSQYTDNDQAATAEQDAEEYQALFESCGRILGHSVVYTAQDIRQSALDGHNVAYFSGATAHRDARGARECYEETIRRGAGDGDIGRRFGELFADPDAVAIEPVQLQTVGDQSLAFTVSGDTTAGGGRVGVVATVVLFRQGPVTAMAGSVRVIRSPETPELVELASMMVDRIQAEFGP